MFLARSHFCRKIFSYSCWPVRCRWRKISGALETLSVFVGQGFETWELRDAPDILRRRMTHIAEVTPCAPSVCGQCGRRKPECCGIVAHAGQSFEVVTLDMVDASAIRLVQTSRYLQHCAHHCLYGALRNPRHDAHTFTSK